MLCSVAGLNYDLVKDDANIEIKLQPSGVGTWIILNCASEQMQNVKLRQAIGYAINYEAMGMVEFSSNLAANSSSLFYYSDEYDAPAELVKYTYDPNKARELLAESGLTLPIDLGDLPMLSIIKNELGDLDRIEELVKVTGFVACDNDFYDQHMILNGVSHLANELFASHGSYVCTAVGTNVLPFNVPIILDVVVKVKQGKTNEKIWPHRIDYSKHKLLLLSILF